MSPPRIKNSSQGGHSSLWDAPTLPKMFEISGQINKMLRLPYKLPQTVLFELDLPDGLELSTSALSSEELPFSCSCSQINSIQPKTSSQTSPHSSSKLSNTQTISTPLFLHNQYPSIFAQSVPLYFCPSVPLHLCSISTRSFTRQMSWRPFSFSSSRVSFLSN